MAMLLKDLEQPEVIKKTGTLRYFWVYTLVLFSAAFILILVAGFFQARAYNNLKISEGEKVSVINQNESMIQNIQRINEQLTANLEKTKSDLEIEKGNKIGLDYELSLSKRDVSNLTILYDAQQLYYQKKSASARKKLDEIDKTTLSLNTKKQYDALYNLLY